jgi:hypothetical protein
MAENDTGIYLDPYQMGEEKQKWQRRITYVIVVLVRLAVAGIKFLLNMVKAVGVETLRAFKLLP